MRVISGSARGRKLLSLEGEATRPTTDRVKESIFNLCMPYIADATALDLFAGSGALGIEALSRGAEKCTFVETAPDALEIVRKNLANTNLLSLAEIHRGDALAFLERITEKFSLIFLDPPYDGGFYGPVLLKIAENNLLSADGAIIMEMRADAPLLVPESFEIIKDRKYGGTKIVILTHKERRMEE